MAGGGSATTSSSVEAARGLIGCIGSAKASRSDSCPGSSICSFGSFGIAGGLRPPKKTMTRPIVCFMLTLVSHSVSASAANHSAIQAPTVPIKA